MSKPDPSAPRPVLSLDEARQNRWLNAVKTTGLLGFGSVWWMSEDLWKEKLPPGYHSNRNEHPGLCVRGEEVLEDLSSVCPFLYGSHVLRWNCFGVPDLSGPGTGVTWFGEILGMLQHEMELEQVRQRARQPAPGQALRLSEQDCRECRLWLNRRYEEGRL